MLPAQDTAKFILFSLLGASAFVAVAYFAQTHSDEIAEIIGEKNAIGMMTYLGIIVISIIIAPINSLFLLPIAANVWGPTVVATLAIIGWTIGAVAAFWLCRKYGKRFVQKIIPFEKIAWLKNTLPSDIAFARLILLRMSVPVDVLSFALGLFTSVSPKKHFFATFLGVIPGAIVASHASVLSPAYQIAASATGIFLFLCSIRLMRLSVKEHSRGKSDSTLSYPAASHHT